MNSPSTTDRRVKRMLIVSPSFPPINTPDLQRARMSLPYYREHGWEPHVLTLDPACHEGPREDALLATVPSDVTIHRHRALSLAWSRRLGIGNLGIRSWAHLLSAGARVIRREKIDLVFLTNTQFLTFPLGRIWRRWLGVPYVIDLQDPWRTDYYERPGSRRPPGGWKYQIARLQAGLLEGWSFRRAGALMSVSAHYLDDLRKRHRWFHEVPTEVIRFGASEADLEIAKKMEAGVPAPPRFAHTVPNGGDGAPPSIAGAKPVHLVYTGAAGPITPHALRVLFDGLALFRRRQPAAAARLRLEFLGTSYAPADRATPIVLPIARECGVADFISEQPARLGHLESLQAQTRADALLLLGSSDLAYSPSKLYPYYLAGRPMLGVVFRDSVLESLLRELACATIVAFEENASKAPAHEALCAFFENALGGFAQRPPPRNDALFRREYLARSLTARQCALFDAALARDAAARPS